jgi:hypothetical protein
MTAASVGVFLTVNLPWLPGFRAFQILIFAFQAARVNDFNRTIGSQRARLSIRLIKTIAAVLRHRPMERMKGVEPLPITKAFRDQPPRLPVVDWQRPRVPGS